MDAKRYPTPAALFTIEKFGGWDAVMKEFFDRDTGTVADIERDLGRRSKATAVRPGYTGPVPRVRRGGGGLAVGLSTAYLSLIVLLPLAALTWRSTEGGWDAFWDAVTNRRPSPRSRSRSASRSPSWRSTP